MKKIIIYSLFCVIIIACGSNGSTVNTEVNQKDSVANSQIDTTSAESFIQSIVNFRKEKEATTPGFEINGELVLTGSEGFKIFNFKEGYDDNNLNVNYAITLNQFDAKTDIQSGNDVYTELTNLLTENNLPFALYEGNFEATADLQLDGAADYILKDERNFRDNIFAATQIYLYDGMNALLSTQIKATKDYTEGENGIVGIKEEIEIKEQKKKYPKIFVHHESSMPYENVNGGMNETHLKYKQSWQWTPTKSEWEPGQWLTGIICDYTSCKNQVASLTEKLTQLSSEYEGFAIVEECYKGQPNFFQLAEYKDEYSHYYALRDNDDDVGTTILIHIAVDEPSTLVLFTARSEKLMANLAGDPEIFLPLQKLTLTNEISAYDQEIIARRYEGSDAVSYYTRNPGEYTFIACTENNAVE